MKFVPRNEATRQRIIESTATLFNKKGYANTSVTDLEKATGLTKGSIYGNFESKEEVALAVLDYNVRSLKSRIREAVERCESYRDKIFAHVAVFYGLQGDGGGCPMQNAAVEADDTNEPMRQKAADAILSWKNDIADLLKKGIKAGEFKKDTDPDQTALTLIALIEGAILLGKATRNIVYLDTVLDVAKEKIRSVCN